MSFLNSIQSFSCRLWSRAGSTLSSPAPLAGSGISFALALLICGLFSWGVGLQFDTNDDMAMITLLKGHYGWTPAQDVPFLSPLLSRALCRLYHFEPDIPWYCATLYGAHLLAIFFGIRLLLAERRPLMSQGILLLVFITLYLYIFCFLNFGSTSLALWLMTSLYLVHLSLRGQLTARHVLPVAAALSLAYLLRPGTLPMELAFTIPLLIIVLVSSAWRHTLGIAAIAGTIILTSLALEYHPSCQGGPRSQHGQKTRSFFYLLGTPSGKQNDRTGEALSRTGWSWNDFRISQYWFLHDESIFSPDNINTFLSHNRNQPISTLVPSLSADYGLQSLDASRPYLLVLTIGILTLLGWAARDPASSSANATPLTLKLLALMALLCILGGIIGLACFRFPHRIFIPLFLYLLLYLALAMPLIISLLKTQGARKAAKCIAWLLALAVLLVVLRSHRNAVLAKAYVRNHHRQHVEGTTRDALEKYGEDTIFILCTPETSFEDARPWRETKDLLSYNLTPFGWMIGSPSYYGFLGKFGIRTGSELIRFALDNDRVIFVFYSSGSNVDKSISLFEAFMNQHYSSGISQLKLKSLADTTSPQGFVFLRLRSAAGARMNSP